MSPSLADRRVPLRTNMATWPLQQAQSHELLLTTPCRVQQSALQVEIHSQLVLMLTIEGQHSNCIVRLHYFEHL